ncbi:MULTISPECIES: hypothetical protein [Nocardia]|uniref:hypothetical protein n=1 Tax=Nocardia TaxID=1817 RepID=UPI0015629C4D|nr:MULTISPECIES: hypothetical protein [Nocardia]MBF6072874.1 hypothetical protein [Nocardia farcinica]MBF6188656.1 hypothetical protein [Nocardia farcinica]MBF6231552.1 hypothetical protein [Nocardia farcinica]MBF6310902.1 hypothetical protein [Nocardia farcinica]MBF6409838.1 hypothetical protein [Nocardia farcinica]
MTRKPQPAAPQVNPIVRAAAEKVTRTKRRTPTDLHAPCPDQLTLFDPKDLR